MIDIEKYKDIDEECMEWTFTKRPTKLWIDTDYGRAVIDTKEHAGTTASWYLEDEAKLMADAPLLLEEVKKLREELRLQREATNRAVDWHLDYIEGTSGSADEFLDYVEGGEEE